MHPLINLILFGVVLVKFAWQYSAWCLHQRQVLFAGYVMVIVAHQKRKVFLGFLFLIASIVGFSPDTVYAAQVEFSILETADARMPEAFIFEGGSLLRAGQMSYIAVLVRHPSGTFLFDTGLGRRIQDQLKEIPFWLRPFFRFTRRVTAVDQLAAGGILPHHLDFILASHLHWDHASGLADFPGVPVWTTRVEHTFALSDEAETPPFVRSQYVDPAIRWNFIDFKDGPYLSFDKVLDVFGDQSVILVSLPGHTQGAIGMILNLPGGRRFFFVGDTVWSLEALRRGLPKPTIISCMADHDPKESLETLIRIKKLHEQNADLRIIPAHDAKAQQGLARFPEFER